MQRTASGLLNKSGCNSCSTCKFNQCDPPLDLSALTASGLSECRTCPAISGDTVSGGPTLRRDARATVTASADTLYCDGGLKYSCGRAVHICTPVNITHKIVAAFMLPSLQRMRSNGCVSLLQSVEVMAYTHQTDNGAVRILCSGERPSYLTARSVTTISSNCV